MVLSAMDRYKLLQEKSQTAPIFNADTTSGAIDQSMAQTEANLASSIEAIQRAKLAREAENQPPETPQFDFSQLDDQQKIAIQEQYPQMDFNSPVAGESAQMGNVPRVTQAFGNRSSVEAFSRGVNLGTDFGVKKGTPLALPPGEWEVMTTFSGAKEGNRGANKGSGNLVKVVNTKTGEMLAFEHLSGVGVRPGQTINGGTVIGLSGNTGNSTGPHASIPYQDAQGKYHDIMSSPYAQYIFGKTSGSTTGKGGGMADIQAKAKEFIDRAKYAGEVVKSVGINALQGLGKTFAYNPETNQAFPQSPYWAIKAANEIQDPELKKIAIQKVATDLAMAGTINSPTAIGKSKITSALDDVARLGKNTPKLSVEPTGGVKDTTYYHQSQSKTPFSSFLQKGDPGYKANRDFSAAKEGVYFSTDKQGVVAKYGKDGGALIEAKLSPKKPLDLGQYDGMYFDGRKVKISDLVIENISRDKPLPMPDIMLNSISTKAKNWLSKNGYDMVSGEISSTGSKETAVLDKSIINTISPKPLSVEPVGGETLNVNNSVKGKSPKLEYDTGGDMLGDQYNGYIIARDKSGKKIGKVSYSYWNGETQVQMIEVDPKFRRQGIGTALLEKLQSESKTPIGIQGDYATAEGQALFNSFRKSNTVPETLTNQSPTKATQSQAPILPTSQSPSLTVGANRVHSPNYTPVAQGGLSDVIKKQLSKYKK